MECLDAHDSPIDIVRPHLPGGAVADYAPLHATDWINWNSPSTTSGRRSPALVPHEGRSRERALRTRKKLDPNWTQRFDEPGPQRQHDWKI